MNFTHQGPTVDVMFQANATLAEGPIWDARMECIYWIDIRRGRISRLDVKSGQQTGVWTSSDCPIHRPGCIALTRDENKILIAAGNKIELLNLLTGTSEEIARLPIDTPRFRANDGRVDRNGRLWVGTMIDDIHSPDAFSGGELFRIDPDGSVFKAGGEFELPNGIGWNGDDTLMYFNDTTTLTTYCFDFDAAAGIISNKRVFYDHSDGTGFPDGLSVDDSGSIWSSQWDGWNIRKISSTGELLNEFPMPVRRPTSAAFYGKNLDRIAITSATVDFVSEDFLKSPNAGSLFSMDANAKGTYENLFSL